jgi:hypothetical protein
VTQRPQLGIALFADHAAVAMVCVKGLERCESFAIHGGFSARLPQTRNQEEAGTQIL